METRTTYQGYIEVSAWVDHWGCDIASWMEHKLYGGYSVREAKALFKQWLDKNHLEIVEE